MKTVVESNSENHGRMLCKYVGGRYLCVHCVQPVPGMFCLDVLGIPVILNYIDFWNETISHQN